MSGLETLSQQKKLLNIVWIIKMITWVTVLVLTVYSLDQRGSAANYQLTYRTATECYRVEKAHKNDGRHKTQCNWQQIPMVTK